MLILLPHVQQKLLKLLIGIYPKTSLCLIVYSHAPHNISVGSRPHIQPVRYNGAKKSPQPGDITVLTRRVPLGSREVSLGSDPVGAWS